MTKASLFVDAKNDAAGIGASAALLYRGTNFVGAITPYFGTSQTFMCEAALTEGLRLLSEPTSVTVYVPSRPLAAVLRRVRRSMRHGSHPHSGALSNARNIRIRPIRQAKHAKTLERCHIHIDNEIQRARKWTPGQRASVQRATSDWLSRSRGLTPQSMNTVRPSESGNERPIATNLEPDAPDRGERYIAVVDSYWTGLKDDIKITVHRYNHHHQRYRHIVVRDLGRRLLVNGDGYGLDLSLELEREQLRARYYCQLRRRGFRSKVVLLRFDMGADSLMLLDHSGRPIDPDQRVQFLLGPLFRSLE